MSSTLTESDTESSQEELGGQMSFLQHLDELRHRLILIIIFVFLAFIGCWFVSNHIYNFLAMPVQRALAEAQRRQLPLMGMTGQMGPMSLDRVKEGEVLRYVFHESTQMGPTTVPSGTSVLARMAKDGNGHRGLYTEEAIVTANTVIPKGVKLPAENKNSSGGIGDDRLVVTTAMEPFSLYVKVSLYAAICLAIPFILYHIWAFVAPGLYPHERSYALPFILLSSTCFVIGALFAYYVLFPPAATYLLGLGQDFRLLLKASDYFDFIILIMLMMGVIFQMPAITYILSRIGIVTAGFLLRVWKVSVIIIFIAAAVLSPTSDILNLMLFAAPMLCLYVISILVAWVFGKPRTVS
jgi:sec-independent protein translocase protein TatC